MGRSKEKKTDFISYSSYVPRASDKTPKAAVLLGSQLDDAATATQLQYDTHQ